MLALGPNQLGGGGGGVKAWSFAVELRVEARKHLPRGLLLAAVREGACGMRSRRA